MKSLRLIAPILLFTAGCAFAQGYSGGSAPSAIPPQTISTTNSAWNCPSNATWVIFHVLSPGGGASGGNGTTAAGGGGGSGCEDDVQFKCSNGPFDVEVGQGGISGLVGSSGCTDGTDGVDSSVTDSLTNNVDALPGGSAMGHSVGCTDSGSGATCAVTDVSRVSSSTSNAIRWISSSSGSSGVGGSSGTPGQGGNGPAPGGDGGLPTGAGVNGANGYVWAEFR